MAAPFTFPPAGHVRSNVSTAFNTCHFVFNDSHTPGREVVAHCGSDLHFPDVQRCRASFQILPGPLNVFFRDLSPQGLRFFIWLVFVVAVGAVEL